MFEALRGLRDAVAPESGNLGGNTSSSAAANDSPEQPDMEELWHAYRAGDKDAVKLVNKVSGGIAPQKREDFVRLHAKMEMEKDTELVTKLASTVLEKSAQIDEQVAALPGMHRTRTEQMSYIEELLALNRKVAEELEESYAVAQQKRDSCRKFIRGSTCQALGIEQEGLG